MPTEAAASVAPLVTRLDDLQTIVEELSDSLTAKGGVNQWLHGRNRLLDEVVRGLVEL